MQVFSRVMIGLDFTDMDHQILRSASRFASICKASKIYFVHIHKDLSFPKKIVERFPQLRVPFDEKLGNELRKKIELEFKDINNYQISVDVIEGNPANALPNYAKIKNIDLLIIGQKTKSGEMGLTPSRTLRAAECSILMIPEVFDSYYSNYIVASDFSDASGEAFQTALQLSSKVNQASLEVVHTFSVSNRGASQFYNNVKIEPLIIEANESNFQEFTSKFAIADSTSEINSKLLIDYYNNGSERLLEYAESRGADIVVAASRGRSMISRFLIGSYAEKLSKKCKKIPLLIVK